MKRQQGNARVAIRHQQSLGRFGEQAALALLSRSSYRVLETNLRVGGGEGDIVARRDHTTVFIEVKTRRSLRYGTPEESVTRAKQRRLIAAAQAYLQAHPEAGEHWRIDVIAIEVASSGRVRRIQHIEGAVTDER